MWHGLGSTTSRRGSSTSFAQRSVCAEDIRTFEAEFEVAYDLEHAIRVATGTDAIELSVRPLDMGPGDPVVAQAKALHAEVTAIARTGRVPMLLDAGPFAPNQPNLRPHRASPPATTAIDTRSPLRPLHRHGGALCCFHMSANCTSSRRFVRTRSALTSNSRPAHRLPGRSACLSSLRPTGSSRFAIQLS